MGWMLAMPYYLALQAEALHLAGRTPEAVETVKEAEALAERSEQRWSSAELHRLRGVFLAALGAEEDLAFLGRAWADPQAHVVSVVAWGGVGKSTLVNHWLRRLGADRYRGAEFVFG